IKEYEDDKYLFMATKNGIVKKTRVSEYMNIRKKGLQAINLREDDELIEIKITDDTADIILVTKNGMSIRFNENDVRSTGRTSMGVIGMNLSYDDEIICMQLNSQGSDILIVSEKGLGKRTDINEFTVQRRGGKGVKCYKVTEKSGMVIGAKIMNDDREVLLITNEGIIIRIAARDISRLGRITTGVKLMNIDSDKDIFVATIAKVKDTNPDGTPITEIEYEEVVEDVDDSEE
ncbi:MAG: DNA gyrase subunit A, partial [Lachnospiraceae bacterium]|nr:DNA gyrase subunit A [Lachnospiraceae bacterium]